MYQIGVKAGPAWIVLLPAVPATRASKGVPARKGRPAVEGLFAPPGRTLRRKAARAAQRALATVDLSDEERELSDEEVDQLLEASDAGAKALIKAALLDWRGIAGPDNKPLPFTPENVELFLEDETLFEAAEQKYVKAVAERDREKNGSAVSPNGTGGAGTPGSATARSAAARKRSAAKPAPTGSTPSRPAKPRRSGRS